MATGRSQSLLLYCIILDHLSFLGSKEEGIHSFWCYIILMLFVSVKVIVLVLKIMENTWLILDILSALTKTQKQLLWSGKRHWKRTSLTHMIAKSTTNLMSFQGNINLQISFVRYHRLRGECHLLAKWKHVLFPRKLVKVMHWRCHPKLNEHATFLNRRYKHFLGIGHIRFVDPHEIIEWVTCSQGCPKTKFRNGFH